MTPASSRSGLRAARPTSPTRSPDRSARRGLPGSPTPASATFRWMAPHPNPRRSPECRWSTSSRASSFISTRRAPAASRRSNELFNRIHTLIDAAVRSNLQHVITDCPHREKLGWLEVSYLMGPALIYDWDLRTVLPKIARDTRETQTAEGLFPDVAPEYAVHERASATRRNGGAPGSCCRGWRGNGTATANRSNSRTRDEGLLRSIWVRSEGSPVVYGLGDWYDIGPGEPGLSKLTPSVLPPLRRFSTTWG